MSRESYWELVFQIPLLYRNVLFSDVCSVFERIEATTKRLEINEILTQFYADLMLHHPNDLVTIVHLSLSRVLQPLGDDDWRITCSWGRPIRGWSLEWERRC